MDGAPSINSFNISDTLHLPLPKYTESWGSDVHRPKSLPESYDDHIDPAHIFAFSNNPETDEEGEFYVVSKRCHRCVKLRRPCTRGEPACRACEEANSTCVTAEGWIELPPPVTPSRAPMKLTREMRMLRRASMPDSLRPVLLPMDQHPNTPPQRKLRGSTRAALEPGPSITRNSLRILRVKPENSIPRRSSRATRKIAHRKTSDTTRSSRTVNSVQELEMQVLCALDLSPF